VLLYIELWLKAPVQMESGSVVPRQAGTPQGGVISQQLANLFLHDAFDKWMMREFPRIPFDRYADDGICPCRTEAEARTLWHALESRLADCKLISMCSVANSAVHDAGRPARSAALRI
jgi:RNA-directed DNA polymerase